MATPLPYLQDTWDIVYELLPVIPARHACRHLMKFLELVARKTEMHEVMLTVQLQNADALRIVPQSGLRGSLGSARGA